MLFLRFKPFSRIIQIWNTQTHMSRKKDILKRERRTKHVSPSVPPLWYSHFRGLKGRASDGADGLMELSGSTVLVSHMQGLLTIRGAASLPKMWDCLRGLRKFWLPFGAAENMDRKPDRKLVFKILLCGFSWVSYLLSSSRTCLPQWGSCLTGWLCSRGRVWGGQGPGGRVQGGQGPGGQGPGWAGSRGQGRGAGSGGQGPGGRVGGTGLSPHTGRPAV